MNRIIIDIEDGIPVQEGLEKIAYVVGEGKISESSNGPHYCWMTVFGRNFDAIIVETRRKKTKQKSDSFKVYKRNYKK